MNKKAELPRQFSFFIKLFKQLFKQLFQEYQILLQLTETN